jgi:hypothetical protein
MANGKPGDHPLTDILVHRLEVYGKETDDLIRRISEICSRRELDEWWEREVGWSSDKVRIHRKAEAEYNRRIIRAREGGWEMPE